MERPLGNPTGLNPNVGQIAATLVSIVGNSIHPTLDLLFVIPAIVATALVCTSDN
jgi:hypothetical protein